MSRYITTHLQIVNKTGNDIADISVNMDDPKQFNANYNLDPFNKASIPSKQSLEKRIDVLNSPDVASGFQMTLTFQNETKDTFYIHQQYAVKCCASFKHSVQDHKISYRKKVYNKWDKKNEYTKIIITVEDSYHQLSQGDKTAKNREDADTALQQGRPTTAVNKLDEALKSSTDKEETDELTKKKSEATFQIGKSYFETAKELEADTNEDKTEEILVNLKQAKTKVEQAHSLNPNVKNEKYLKLIDLKLEGIEVLQKANESEKKAFEIFVNTKKSANFADYKDVVSAYKEAVSGYESAKAIFEKDPADFEGELKTIQGSIDGIRDAFDQMERAELKDYISRIQFIKKD